MQLGAVAGVDTGTRGTTYFDAFESRRDTYIGPVGLRDGFCRCHRRTTLDWGSGLQITSAGRSGLEPTSIIPRPTTQGIAGTYHSIASLS